MCFIAVDKSFGSFLAIFQALIQTLFIYAVPRLPLLARAGELVLTLTCVCSAGVIRLRCAPYPVSDMNWWKQRCGIAAEEDMGNDITAIHDNMATGLMALVRPNSPPEVQDIGLLVNRMIYTNVLGQLAYVEYLSSTIGVTTLMRRRLLPTKKMRYFPSGVISISSTTATCPQSCSPFHHAPKGH